MKDEGERTVDSFLYVNVSKGLVIRECRSEMHMSPGCSMVWLFCVSILHSHSQRQ